MSEIELAYDARPHSMLEEGFDVSNLTELLRQQKDAEKNKSVRGVEKKREWILALNQLFDQIKQWLSQAQKEGSVEVTEEQVSIHEETVGQYKAPLLSLKVGKTIIKLRPKGMTIIGANGRVDMESTKGTYMLLYLSPPNIWVHGVGYKPDQFPQLTEELFTELLKKSLS